MSLARAAAIVRAGGIVAYPTEAVYGLGCDPRQRRAVLRILRMKRRPAFKGLIVIAARAEQLAPFIDSAALPAHVRASWPGPHTWLLPARARVPFWLRGRHRTLAVRVSAQRHAAQLCLRARSALVSTSANRARQRPARSSREVQRRFGGQIDYVLRGRVGGARRPTPIRDAASGAVVRSG